MGYTPTPQTPFFQAVLQIQAVGGTLSVIPAKPGASLMCPMNYQYPPLIGNAYQWTEGEGLQTPAVDVEFLVRDAADAAAAGGYPARIEALGATMMGLLFDRSNDIKFDTSSCAITYWDGQTGFSMPNAKAESFTISVSKNDAIRMSVRFVAAANTGGDDTDAVQTVSEAPTLINWDDAPALYFNAFTIADQAAATGTAGTPAGVGYLANKVWGYNLSFANNHTPNLALDGTIYPDDMNAGSPTGGCTLSMQAADGPPVDGSPIVATIAGANITRVFTINNPRNQTLKNRQVAAPRVMRNHQLVCRGKAGREASGWGGGSVANGPVIYS